MILSRDALCATLRNLPPHARGRRELEKLARKMTTEELTFECELEQALREALERDPAFAVHGGLF